jgi:hypothetical protein
MELFCIWFFGNGNNRDDEHEYDDDDVVGKEIFL